MSVEHKTLSLGQRIRKARIAAGLRQADVAARMGTQAPCVCFWEREQREPTLSSLRRLASAIGCKVADLIG